MTSKNSNTIPSLNNRVEDFRPSEFMRARRPNLFSDSVIIEKNVLPQVVLEYHLDSLTSRKQEIEFEYFCRRLAEKEICPNLLPQTGPTGGGDSKTDSENYPVADALALRWYEGLGRQSSQERWAFAFSTKKQWRPKIKEDMAQIAAQKRGYRVAFFISSQFIKDKDRATVQDQLAKLYGLDVRILDRSWILKCVYEHDRVGLAIEALNIVGYDTLEYRHAGPEDTIRAVELAELENQIRNPEKYQGENYALADDCLQAAILTRGLDRPRTEVDGMFDRARRIADLAGHQQQRLRVVYQHAWTTYWWFDDVKGFEKLYSQVEELSLGTGQASDLELLTNLWMILYTEIHQRGSKQLQDWLENRTAILKKELGSLVSIAERQNNSLWARKNLLGVKLIEAVARRTSQDEILVEFQQLLIDSKGLSQVPIDSTLKLIQELGNFYPDSSAYDELFKVVLSVSESRKRQSQSGLLLLERGLQKLRAEKKYDAIRLLGLAQQELALEEYDDNWIVAMATCGIAYESAGLFWGARANTLMALNQAMTRYLHGEVISHVALPLAQKLIWLELQLGRIFAVLTWIDFTLALKSQLKLTDEQSEAFEQERQTQDIVLSILFLRVNLSELRHLDFLPAILESLNLSTSHVALLYSLGHEDYLREEGYIPESDSPESVADLFFQILSQPAGEDIPQHPELAYSSDVEMFSSLIGCNIKVLASNNNISLSLAETILSSAEALLATSLDMRVLPYVSSLKLSIHPSEYMTGLPQIWVDEDSDPKIINIRHPANLRLVSTVEAAGIENWLKEFLISLIGHIAIIEDAVTFAEHLFGKEGGLNRALSFSHTEIALTNLVGGIDKLQFSHWNQKPVARQFPLTRDHPWHSGLLLQKESKSESTNTPWLPAEGDPPEDLIKIDSLKHKDRQILSLINIPVWDKAGWQATAFYWDPDFPPIMMLGFKNFEAAKTIFTQWHSRLGNVDVNEELRVSVIMGIQKQHSARYKILISTNPDIFEAKPSSHFVIVARVLMMDPPDLRNINRFRSRYEAVSRYVLIPAHFERHDKFPQPVWDLGIEKIQVNFREAWQIGENDQDLVAISSDDDPIIPEGIVDAPILRTMAKIKRQRPN